MTYTKASHVRTAGYIAANTYEVNAPRSEPDADAIRAELIANSARFFAEDAAAGSGDDGAAQPLHVCHCGQPLDDGGCECGDCTAEWNEYLTERGEVLETLN